MEEELNRAHGKTTDLSDDGIIQEFISKSAGLTSKLPGEGEILICQQADGKSLTIRVSDIEEVLTRQDSDGQVFLQVNFIDGKKILLTDNLIGFKPARCRGLDMSKLPKVVTTPDLLSVVEAIEESLSSSEDTAREEVEVLRRVFDSVLKGAESVGFDLTSERVWFHQFSIGSSKASA